MNSNDKISQKETEQLLLVVSDACSRMLETAVADLMERRSQMDYMDYLQFHSQTMFGLLLLDRTNSDPQIQEGIDALKSVPPDMSESADRSDFDS